MKVKVCGITNLKDAMLCYNLGADAIGFIFYKKSKRYIKPEEAKYIIGKLPPFIQKVGVFVNEPSIAINNISKEIKLNIIQLHGDETPHEINEVELPVIKAFRVKDDFDYSKLSEYKNCSFLLDTFSNNEYGGTGNSFDWKQIPKELKTKIIIAGGVSADNIEYIYKNINPAAVDLSSSLEQKPGEKDEQKLKYFFKHLNELRTS